ncbi:hypothetical protein Tco_0014452 [Tanacetum coccineum]
MGGAREKAYAIDGGILYAVVSSRMNPIHQLKSAQVGYAASAISFMIASVCLTVQKIQYDTKHMTGISSCCVICENFLGTVFIIGNAGQFAPIIASKLPLSNLWRKHLQPQLILHTDHHHIVLHGKMAYHIINDRTPYNKNIFTSLVGTCYLTRDGENLDKMKEKGDPCVMVGYSTQSKGYRVFNKRTRLIVKSIYIKFDEIKEMMSDHNSLDLCTNNDNMKSVGKCHSVPRPQMIKGFRL